MADQNEDLGEFLKSLGLDQEAVKGIETENFSQEKQKLLERIMELYLTDQQSFNEFVKESGLEELITKLDQTDASKLDSEKAVVDLREEVEEKIDKENVNIDLDI